MKPDKLKALKEILNKNIYRVDWLSGQVYGKDKRPLGNVNNHGYVSTTFRFNGRRITIPIHQIVAYAGGLDVLDPMTVNHKDGNKLNNCLFNLETITAEENIKHAWRMGLCKRHLMPRGSEHPLAKLTWEQVRQIRNEYIPGVISTRKLGKKYGVCHSQIVRIIHNQHYAI